MKSILGKRGGYQTYEGLFVSMDVKEQFEAWNFLLQEIRKEEE